MSSQTNPGNSDIVMGTSPWANSTYMHMYLKEFESKKIDRIE